MPYLSWNIHPVSLVHSLCHLSRKLQEDILTQLELFRIQCYHELPLLLRQPPHSLQSGLEKVLVSPWLVTLLHICGVIPTPQSPVTPHDRWRRRAEHRRLRIERRYRRIKWPPHGRRRRCPKRRRLRIERRYRRIEWPLSSVSWCFKSISWCFTSGSRCFTMYHNVWHVFHDVLLCLTMFYDV